MVIIMNNIISNEIFTKKRKEKLVDEICENMCLKKDLLDYEEIFSKDFSMCEKDEIPILLLYKFYFIKELMKDFNKNSKIIIDESTDILSVIHPSDNNTPWMYSETDLEKIQDNDVYNPWEENNIDIILCKLNACIDNLMSGIRNKNINKLIIDKIDFINLISYLELTYSHI